MSESAGWKADPFGRHEVRYHDGTAWTAHVSDGGVQGTDEPVPSPPGAVPPPPPAAAPSGGGSGGGGGGGWRDKLKAVTEQGKELAEKGRQALAEQQAARAEQIANDPNTLWTGEKKSAGTSTGKRPLRVQAHWPDSAGPGDRGGSGENRPR